MNTYIDPEARYSDATIHHGITPDIPPEHAAAMIEAVHKYSPQYHKETP